jgi:hypothetical protein
VDDFVQTVLATKSALVGAVVDGEALAADLSGSVLDELQRALHAISPGLADAPQAIEDEDLIDRLLRQASEEFRSAHPAGQGARVTAPGALDVASLRKALEGLLEALSGGSSNRYRIASTSQPGSVYEIVADGADVTCSCPGFEYRGQCRHAREVKTALAAGRPLPPQYARVAPGP